MTYIYSEINSTFTQQWNILDAVDGIYVVTKFDLQVENPIEYKLYETADLNTAVEYITNNID